MKTSTGERILDSKGVIIHEWLVVKNEEHILIPINQRHKMSENEQGQMVAGEDVKMLSLDVLCDKLCIPATMANANMVAYYIEGMNYMSLEKWEPTGIPN